MNLKVEEILILIVAFIIGYFVSNMISGSSSQPIARIKKNESKHPMIPITTSNCEDILERVCQGAIQRDIDSCKACANRRRDSAKRSARTRSNRRTGVGLFDWPTNPRDQLKLGEIQCNILQSDNYCESINFKKKRIHNS